MDHPRLRRAVAIPQYIPLRGKSGRVIANLGNGPQEIVACTEIEFNIEIEQIEVLQGMGWWKSRIAGDIDGSGTFTVEKNDSFLEQYLLPFVTMNAEQARALRDQGKRLREPFTLSVSLDDPQVLAGYEEVTLGECNIWNIPGGYSRGGKVTRRYNFTFERIVPQRLIPRADPSRSPLSV